ncbi:carboxypeptidase-like regulatory domain-containing protein [uncultured Algibacter sp.]|uniref:carboxypeptidase-like regulatory domain-containing protein n=1 Tax=uncultured Algibacter sp. TaxID=298659 RepID=UPI002627DB5A|nr:carboxypeptidase-like regulatory domain-containing protein [uncultured Algibacter sp.]
MNIKITLILLLASFTVFSQNITAKLIDKSTKKPIPYATIKTGDYSGVISNDDGFFTINSEYGNKSLTISCMGYQNKIMTIHELNLLKHIIELDVAINQLGEVYISNKAANADSIITKVKNKLAINYSSNLNKHSVFRRTTDYVDFKSLEFEIEKASHVKKRNLESVNEDLQALSNKIKESNIVQFDDFKGEFYAFNKDSSKLKVNKATQLLDYKNDFSVEQIQEKAQHIILKYLDTTKTYKLKTGIFKIEDSLSLKDENQEERNKHEYKVSHLNHATRKLLRHSQFYENSFLDKLLSFNLYEYTYEDTAYNNNELTHIISFTPKRGKAKYTGQLFISNNTYAITRVDYKYYKNRHGEKVNLKLILGVKYIGNVSTGTLLFAKDSSNIYNPKYLKRTTGSYFYINRDVKFIENSTARNKVSFSFKIEGDNQEKEELLFTANSKLSLQDFEGIIEDSVVPYKQLSKFEKTIWDNEQIIEPTLEMKAFTTN